MRSFASYATAKPAPPRTGPPDVAGAVERAVAHGDAHAVKLTEAAVRARPLRAGLQASAAAAHLVPV